VVRGVGTDTHRLLYLAPHEKKEYTDREKGTRKRKRETANYSLLQPPGSKRSGGRERAAYVREYRGKERRPVRKKKAAPQSS